ncbi:MAG: Fur family transcriptional regulator [Chloroflexota bacterium]|nr:Fur family transcriptional regulator [Chloroflexota bacterium]
MQRVLAAFRQRGYKVTPQRRAVLQVIADCDGHLTPGDIHKRVCEEHPGVGLVTVYRTLDILAEMGLICEVHPDDRRRSYLLRRPDEHHHHLICSTCGRVVDFTGCQLEELEKKLCRETGFSIEGHLLEFVGRCPSCQEKVTYWAS